MNIKKIRSLTLIVFGVLSQDPQVSFATDFIFKVDGCDMAKVETKRIDSSNLKWQPITKEPFEIAAGQIKLIAKDLLFPTTKKHDRLDMRARGMVSFAVLDEEDGSVRFKMIYDDYIPSSIMTLTLVAKKKEGVEIFNYKKGTLTSSWAERKGAYLDGTGYDIDTTSFSTRVWPDPKQNTSFLFRCTIQLPKRVLPNPLDDDTEE